MLDIKDFPDLALLLQSTKVKALGELHDLSVWPEGRVSNAKTTVRLNKVNFDLIVQNFQERCEADKKKLYNGWINESGSEGFMASLNLVKEIPENKLYQSVKENPEIRQALATALKSHALGDSFHETLFSAFLDSNREKLTEIQNNGEALERFSEYYDTECEDVFRPLGPKHIRAAIDGHVDQVIGKA